MRSEDLARALGCVPSGLFVLTAGTGGAATGLLASFVQQLGFDPPVIGVALRRGRPAEALVRATGQFCISILAEGERALLGHFARGFDAGEPAFEGIEIDVDPRGIPLPKGALAYLGCAVVGETAWTDHVLFGGEVVFARHSGRDGRPAVHVRKNGLSY